MAYYLTVENSRGEYLELPIKKLAESGYFSKESKFTNESACSLQEIDQFTCQFNNELSLRKVLGENGILPSNLIHKRLSIRYKRNGKLKKLMYDLLYQKDIENINDPERIINIVYQRFLKHDYDLILKIFIHFKEYRDCSSTAPEIIYMIRDTIIYNRLNHNFLVRDENGDEIIKRGLKLLIYEYDERNGKVYYTKKIKYRYLHELIALINDHDKQKVENNTPIKITDEYEDGECLPSIPENNKKHPTSNIVLPLSTPKSKKRVRKIIPNQISLFDNE